MTKAISLAVFPDNWRTRLTHGSRVFRTLFVVLAIFLGSTAVAQAATATATWSADTGTGIAGYILSYGTQPGVHPTVTDVGNVTTFEITTLSPGQVYYFVVQAYNTSAMTSVDSTEVAFTVPVASLTSLNPTSGIAGTAVTITGANFQATQGTSTVTFNGTAAVPTSWSATSIVVPVPIAATTGLVVVTEAGVASNGISFTVTLPAPSLTSLNPTSGTVGIAVTIAGANFGPTQGTSTVKFNGTAATPTNWSTTSITVPVPSAATTGTIVVTVGGVASNGISFTVTAARRLDFDGDGKTDLTVYRPSNGIWFVLKSSTNYTTSNAYQFGMTGDVPVPGDYDGDGKTDVAVYRPSNATWFILKSSTNYTTWQAYQFGAANSDIPVPGDYDGDGKTDIAVYRPSNATWFILNSSTNYTTSSVHQWGASGDIPIPGDYDGDGKTDIVVYRPSNATWFILNSSTNYTTSSVHQWGASTDIVVPGDYDGDGKTDVAVYRPSTATWYILNSSTNYTTSTVYQWGAANGDIPVPGDYDGDGKTDFAVYRPSTATWFFVDSSTNYATWNMYQWGASSDVPLVGHP